MTEDLHHLAAAYALNALDDDETRAFEAHYENCDICKADVQSGREVAALLASTEEVQPPDELRSSVLDEIARTRQIAPQVPEAVVQLAERRRRFGANTYVLGAAAAALIVIVGAWFALRGDDALSTADQLAAIQAADDAIMLPLEGTDGTISVVWSEERGQLGVIGADLSPVGADQAYALWLVDRDGAQAAGLFSPDDDGVAQFVAPLNGDPEVWAVTIEPASGSPQPTTDIIYSASTT